MPSFPTVVFPAISLEFPEWLTGCLGFTPGTARRDFVFDSYHSDEFDHLLSADPTSGSFLSRLSFGRKLNKRPTRVNTDNSSTDGSLRSLFVDDRDAELFGEDSINMLLTSNTQDGPESYLPIDQRPSQGQDDEVLRREEDDLRRAEEAEIASNRDRAKKLAIKRGLVRTDTHSTSRSSLSQAATINTRSSRSASVRSQMSQVGRKLQDSDEAPVSGILPHMRPS